MKLIVTSICIFAVCLFLVINLASAMKITDCGGNNPDAKLGTVTIQGCTANDDACPLVRGENASIEIQFDALKTFKQAKLDVAGKLGIWLPFPMNPDDACGNYGVNCPVNVDDKNKLLVSLPVARSYPKLRLDVRLRLLDENKSSILCITFPARIQDPKKI